MKRLLSVFLLLFLFFSLCACKGPEEKIVTEEAILNVLANEEFETPKNVILILGDGMGPNDIEITQRYGADLFSFGLILNKIPHHGLMTTHSANNAVTDSAAAATALATGVKTDNGMIGKNPAGEDLKSVTQIAREQGKKIGIITNDKIYGATPSAFGAHNLSRDNEKELLADLLSLRPDVLIGSDFEATKELADGSDFSEFLLAKGIDCFGKTFGTDPTGTMPFLGFINPAKKIPSDDLAQSATFALDRLKNEKGFFLMIESAGTDLYGHNKNIEGKMAGVVTLDRTVAQVLLFMKDNPDTLLIVTSDHETGGVQLPQKNQSPTNKLFTGNKHTATPVRIFAVGKGSEYFQGTTVDNTDLARFLINAIQE